MDKSNGGLFWAGLLAAAMTLASTGAIARPAKGHARGAEAAVAATPNPDLGPGWKGRVYPTSQDLFAAMRKKASRQKKTYANLPNWKGIWTRRFIGGSPFSFGAYQPQNPKAPPGYAFPTGAKLTPDYQAKWERKIDDLNHGKEWDQLSACLPAGFPRWTTEPFLREFIVTPDQTWWINEMQSEVRRIYTDGRGHIPDDEAYPMWEGDSIGFWDGATLVVHTNNVRPGQYQRGQPDYSDQTTTVERIHMQDKDTMVDEIWVYDPVSLTQPWHVQNIYDRVKEPVRISMWSCNENNNVVKTADGASALLLPGDKGYKDPGAITEGPK